VSAQSAIGAGGKVAFAARVVLGDSKMSSSMLRLRNLVLLLLNLYFNKLHGFFKSHLFFGITHR
jgi:hypothetical protein